MLSRDAHETLRYLGETPIVLSKDFMKRRFRNWANMFNAVEETDANVLWNVAPAGSLNPFERKIVKHVARKLVNII